MSEQNAYAAIDPHVVPPELSDDAETPAPAAVEVPIEEPAPVEESEGD